MTKKTVYINYVDGIDMGRVKNLMAIVSTIVAQEKPDILYFLFSSPGGEVDAGVALYNFFKALPVKIVMHNIGSIDSIANVIFMAGSTRYAVPHATFLFHGVQMQIKNPTTLALPNLKEMLDRIDKNHNTIAGIVCENSKLKEEVVRKLFAEGETKDVNFALGNGIISKTKLAQIPKGSLFVSVNING